MTDKEEVEVGVAELVSVSQLPSVTAETGSHAIHFHEVTEEEEKIAGLSASIALHFLTPLIIIYFSLQAIPAVMVKVCIISDVIKPFFGQGDVVVWLKKVRLVARLQQVDDVASLLPLYLEGDVLALYMEMEEKDQRDVDQIKARLKEAFTEEKSTKRSHILVNNVALLFN